jgi:predicted HicB family RNase H-like nuclease
MAPAQPEAPSDEDTLLTAVEAAAIVRRSTKWLYRRAAKLPFARRLDNRSWVFSKKGLDKWINKQRAWGDLTAKQQAAILPHMKTAKREAATMFRLTVRVPENLAEKAKIRAIRDRKTLQQLVTDALESYLKAKPKGEE